MPIDPAPRPVPLDLDPAAIRRQADEIERDAEQRAGAILTEAREKAAALRTAADRIEDARELMRRAAGMMGPKGDPAKAKMRKGLPSAPSTSSLSVAMPQAESLQRSPRKTKRRSDKPGRPILSKHPFALAVSRTPDMSMEKWADAHGYKAKTVKAWYAEGEGGRKIPRPVAEMIEREFKDEKGETLVPADEDTWPNGIR